MGMSDTRCYMCAYSTCIGGFNLGDVSITNSSSIFIYVKSFFVGVLIFNHLS